MTTNPEIIALARDVCGKCSAPVTIFNDKPKVGIVTVKQDKRTKIGRAYFDLPYPLWSWQCGACDWVNEYTTITSSTI